MRMYDVIEKKKRGTELSRDEIFEMIRMYTNGDIPDYQMSSFLMAVYFKSMSARETFDLTEAMATSGDTVDLSCFGDRSVDKHSTGGVGDKTTLIVGPIVASAGGIVAKMSGRGLGHTGGTVDKLESFPGFKTSLSPFDFKNQVKKCGIAVIGQSGDLAPADKKLYALRDVTATVDSLPLIASSIMSKKLAAGTRSIVLDVKFGSGAFMNTPEDAEALAKMMVDIGRAHRRNTYAVISNMDVPLGNAIGNSLEICEAIKVLRGHGPEDLREVCLTLASLMIAASCKLSEGESLAIAKDELDSGRAFKKLCEWIELQGGNVEYVYDTKKFKSATHSIDVVASSDGYISKCNAEMIGNAAVILGAGRKTKDSLIDHSAGIYLMKKTSDKIQNGDVIAKLYTNDQSALNEAKKAVIEAISITDKPVQTMPLIYKII